MEKIIHLRLINGQEIIGTDGGTDFYQNLLVLNPMLVEEYFDPKTMKANIVLNRYNILTKTQQILLKAEHLLTIGTVSDAARDYYLAFLQSLEDNNSAEYIDSKINEATSNIPFLGHDQESSEDELYDLSDLKTSSNTIH